MIKFPLKNTIRIITVQNCTFVLTHTLKIFNFLKYISLVALDFFTWEKHKN